MLNSTFDLTHVRGFRPLTGSFDPNRGDETLLVVKSVLIFAYVGSKKTFYFNLSKDNACVVLTKIGDSLELNISFYK
jgi:hypothetical protein